MLGFGAKNQVKMPEAVSEIASFEYIDQGVDAFIERSRQVTENDRIAANKKAKKSIAGFRVLDPEQEKKELDRMVAKRNEVLDTFIKDRSAVRAKLDVLGVKTMAVVPLKAWASICQKADLIVMKPSSKGTVTISRNAVTAYGSPASIEREARQDYASYIRSLFPNDGTHHAGMDAHLVLPEPPEEVVAILLKVQALALHVAAVPEAISFLETPGDLFRREQKLRDEEEARRLEALRRDPIVFHEHGTAAAIIAQFGDFPIEKAVVDAVIATDDLIPERPSAVDYMQSDSLFQQHNNILNSEYERQMMVWRKAQAIGGGGAGGSGGGGVSISGGGGLGSSTRNLFM